MRRVSTATGAFLLGVTACGVSASPSGDRATRAGAPTAAVDAGAVDTGGADARATKGGAVSYATVPLFSCTGGLYTAAVTIGGTQDFQLAVDTGSTTLAVAASTCSECSGVEPLYAPGAGAQDEHEDASSAYGTGTWSGEIYRDLVSLGVAPDAGTDPPATAEALPIVAIDGQSGFFMPAMCDSTSGGYQGILGLGPLGSAVQGTTGYLDALVSHGVVPDVFALQLCDRGGTLWLGGYDPAAATGPFVYTPEVSSLDPYYYAIDLEAIRLLGQRVPVATEAYRTSIVDAGSTVFLLGRKAFDQLTAAIAASPEFVEVFGNVGGKAWFDGDRCAALPYSKADLDAKLPQLTLELGTDPAALVPLAPTESYLVPLEGEWCPALDVIDPSFEVPFAADLGTPVMRSSVTLFDRARGRVGFAPHAPCP